MTPTPLPDPLDKPKLIVVRVTAREKRDSADVIRQVREALKVANIPIRIRLIEREPDAASTGESGHLQGQEPPVSVEPDAALTEAVKKVAAAVLNQKARELAASPDQAAKPSPEDAAKIKKALWKWLGEKAAAGWRVTVGAALEWAKKQVTG